MTRAPVLDLLDAAPAGLSQRPGSDRAAVMTGTVTAVSTDGTLVTVRILGSEPIQLPATASVWTGISTASILMDPATGRPVHVLGPAPKPLRTLIDMETEDLTLPATGTTTITPEWSGTWSSREGWDRWNTNRFGGRSDLYQGQASGRTLRGLATYGQRVTALGADTITSASLTVTSNGAVQAAGTVSVQCADWSEGGPVTSGPVVSGTCRPGAPATLDITPLGPGLIAGRGMALVGADYLGALGTGASMAIGLTWRGPA